MRLPTCLTSFVPFLALLLTLAPYTSATKFIESSSLEACMDDSGFTASYFTVVFTPVNDTITFDIVGISTITGNITAKISVSAYGYDILDETVDLCSLGLSGICPISSGNIDILSSLTVPSSVNSDIPGIAYTLPDLDGVVTIQIYSQSTGDEVACVTAELSNGKTVYQKGVGWATAVVAGLALLVSAIVSGLGHSNTASHIAANAMSLFAFFQGQALMGMTAISLPPIVSAWTQNFQWSMGIIRIGFIQNICAWYQQATGGTPSTLLSSLSSESVNVQKRSVEALKEWAPRAIETMQFTPLPRRALNLATNLAKRSSGTTTVGGVVTVKGIERVGFRLGIEITNIFLTGYIFFVIFIGFVVLSVVSFRWILEALVKTGKMKNDKFLEFRNGWTTILRGILFRLILIGFPQMVVLCFWELTKQDSAGEEALAAVTIVTMLIMLAYACLKVWTLAKRSVAMHKNPAYILYSDPVALHKWGFLYVQFKATAYWFIGPLLLYILIFGLFVGFGQSSGAAQAIGILILNAALLVSIIVLRPYMDRKTNAFNIGIAVVNLLSAIFLLFFTDVFGLPGLVNGVMGILFFFINAVFALVLIILMLIGIGYAIFSKNPDVRYQPMRDDRGSFIKSQTQLTTELDALGATARGENKLPLKQRDIDEDSYSGSSWDDRQNANGASGNLGSYQAISEPYNKELSGSPNPNNMKGVNTSYESGPYASQEHTRSNLSVAQTPNRGQTASPWQRGAGYDR